LEHAILGWRGGAVKTPREPYIRLRGSAAEVVGIIHARRHVVKETELACELCGISAEERRTQKCAICYKRYCEECAVKFSGRSFCSRFCGEYFFFGGDDDV
jgi:hypothetical protein